MILKKYYLPIAIILICILVSRGLFAQDNLNDINPLNHISLNIPSDSIKIESDSLILLSDSLLTRNDSIQNDSILTVSDAIDAPITGASKDSMVMIMDGHNMIFLYGSASIQYKNMSLEGEYLEVDADSSIVYSTFGKDSIGAEFGYPVFKEGDTSYEMKKARYNFKSKKMFISDVITQQGEGYVTAGETKKMPNDELFMVDGRYTTCDEHDHPHFYLQLTKAKIQPGKRIVTGPAYLVVEDVPLPLALPFGFFPFSSDYSSGVIMPTYGDELTRGFSLRDGGYYFAFNDYIDLALTGEIFTKGSWGLDARSTYRKRYKFRGSFQGSYRETVTELENSVEKSKKKDMMLIWSHTQDAKANPFSSFSASVNFSTSSYNRNDITSIYSDRLTENAKRSNINYSYRPPKGPFSFNMNASINQVSRDTSMSITFPSLTITMSDIYPLRRKEMVGNPRWYENIRIRYSGSLTNSITAKEYEILHKNLIKDWKNGMRHNIPISASFTLFKNITLTTSANYTERWYTSAINKKIDGNTNNLVPQDTIYGFYRVYDYDASLSLNTKLYGMYKPWNIFGNWAKQTVIRHVFTPQVSFSGAPDFGDPKYGYWKTLNYMEDNEMQEISYSPFQHPNNIYGVPSQGRQGNLSFSLDNNLEMKVPVADTDSTRKISLIDQLQLRSGYNFLADSLNWSNIRASLRIKFGKAYTLSLQGEFDVYLYGENGRRINKTRLEAGKGLGRLISTGTSFSYSLSNQTIKNLFSKKNTSTTTVNNNNETLLNEEEVEVESVSYSEIDPQKKGSSLRQSKAVDNNYDENGYYLSNIPWNLNFNYSLAVGYDRQNFDREKREYPYEITQSLGISGNITPTKNWSFNFSTYFDFEYKKFTTMQCSITRQMHCWQMSASVIPIGPYQSYQFTIAVSSSLLQDLKYTQSSNYRDAKNWGR